MFLPENMERFAPVYAIAYAIMNSMENLRFDKESYFHVLFFYTGYFIKEIENISPRVPIRYRNTRGSLEELKIAWKHSLCQLMFPRNVEFSQTSARVSTV